MPTKPTDFQVPFDESFRVGTSLTNIPSISGSRLDLKKALKQEVKKLAMLQEKLYAAQSHSILLIFQAMDAAGKDSTIRAVTSGVNPAGFQVTSFKAPSDKELAHDFLWRTTRALPERGRIGIFNRSHYEDTLVVRVHPELLNRQHTSASLESLWKNRFEAIRHHEKHLHENGTIILKFWLNVSRDEQLNRFERRLTKPEKYWKFSPHDLDESDRWTDYMHAYEEMLNATSRPWAPWFAIPADSKPKMRLVIARLINETIEKLDLKYPDMPDSQQVKIPSYLNRISKMRETLT